MAQGKDIIKLNTGGDTSVHVKAEGNVIVRPRVVKKLTPPPEGAISVGQRAIFKDEVNKWVSASKLVGRSID